MVRAKIGFQLTVCQVNTPSVTWNSQNRCSMLANCVISSILRHFECDSQSSETVFTHIVHVFPPCLGFLRNFIVFVCASCFDETPTRLKKSNSTNTCATCNVNSHQRLSNWHIVCLASQSHQPARWSAPRLPEHSIASQSKSSVFATKEHQRHTIIPNTGNTSCPYHWRTCATPRCTSDSPRTIINLAHR